MNQTSPLERGSRILPLITAGDLISWESPSARCADAFKKWAHLHFVTCGM